MARCADDEHILRDSCEKDMLREFESWMLFLEDCGGGWRGLVCHMCDMCDIVVMTPHGTPGW